MSKDSHFHLKPALVAPTSFHFWYLLSNSVQSIFKFWIWYSFHTSELFRVYLSISSSWWCSNYLFKFFFCLISLYNHEIIETGFMLNSWPILAEELSGQALESDILASQLTLLFSSFVKLFNISPFGFIIIKHILILPY